MPLSAAASSVQHNALPDAYARWEATAKEIVASPPSCPPVVTPAQTSKAVGPPNRKAVASALQYLGTPYSWGGRGIGRPGKGSGPGTETVDLDCSSLVQLRLPPSAWPHLPMVTDAPAAALRTCPRQLPFMADDLLFFRGPRDPPGRCHHRGIYDGQGGMVRAPRIGKTVEVVHNVLSDPYYSSQLALVARPASAGPASKQAPRRPGVRPRQ
jgi:cell wall-associated NlpC family hydrolase